MKIRNICLALLTLILFSCDPEPEPFQHEDLKAIVYYPPLEHDKDLISFISVQYYDLSIEHNPTHIIHGEKGKRYVDTVKLHDINFLNVQHLIFQNQQGYVIDSLHYNKFHYDVYINDVVTYNSPMINGPTSSHQHYMF
jgi:hypothetical protein